MSIVGTIFKILRNVAILLIFLLVVNVYIESVKKSVKEEFRSKSVHVTPSSFSSSLLVWNIDENDDLSIFAQKFGKIRNKYIFSLERSNIEDLFEFCWTNNLNLVFINNNFVDYF